MADLLRSRDTQQLTDASVLCLLCAKTLYSWLSDSLCTQTVRPNWSL